MVNFVIDNLLSSTKNRVFYETLWSLVIHKKKVEQQKYHVICLAQICNDLLEELNNDEQNELEQKSRFYLTTQLAFGAIQVYKLQIDKLFYQVKHALATCTSKAFELDWLNSSQPLSEKSVKKRKIEKDVLLECKALECFDDVEFKVPQHTKKNQKIQSIDPTTVICSRTITLFDQFYPTQSTADSTDDDFGVMTLEEFETFVEPVQESQQSDRTTVRDHTKLKKRKYSEAFEPNKSQESDRTTIWDHTKNMKRKYSDVFDDDIPRNSSQTKRAKSCGTLQDFSYIEDRSLHDVSLFEISTNQSNIIDDHTFVCNQEINLPVLENTENFDLYSIQSSVFCDEMILPKVNQSQLKKKQKQKYDRIFVDKFPKMPVKNNLSTLFDQYQNHHMEDLPRVNFDQMIYKHKFGVNVLFQTASRPIMSQHLLKQFKRHLKKIPQTVIDRKCTRKPSITKESTPISKQATSKMNPAVVKYSGEITNNSLLEMELPDVEDEMLKSARMSLWMVEDEIIAEPVAKLKPKTHNTVLDVYIEDKRWSKEMIMERLEVLWNIGKQQINMQILCGRLNRFVCAGIFFELMNLSKIGLITLESKDGCPEIYHIKRNEF